MHYIVGDIHGEFGKLKRLMAKITPDLCSDDIIVFLGDYIDRGANSFSVVEFIVELSTRYTVIPLMGNHELMLKEVLAGTLSPEHYYYNGGKSTIHSYKEHLGQFYIPESHKKILFSNIYYYQTDTFIAVHAGLPPDRQSPEECDSYDLVWIREQFYKSENPWQKTVIFGHTPTFIINRKKGEPYFDEERNIIGLDTGAAYNGPISCLRFPDKKLYQSD